MRAAFRFFLCLAIPPASLVLAQTNSRTTNPVTTETPEVFKVETGFGYSRGDYGLAIDTEVWFAPVAIAYDAPEWAARVSVPWITIKGPAVAIASTGLLRPTAERKSGIGDLQLSGTYKLLHEPGQPKLGFTGKVKVPTGDEYKGLGTGATDYTAQFDLLQTFGTITPFGAVGYRWLGDNGIYQLDSGFFANAGAAFRIADGFSVGASYEWREPIAVGSDASSEVSAFVFKRLNPRWSVTLYGLKGFSDSSAGFALGGNIAYQF